MITLLLMLSLSQAPDAGMPDVDVPLAHPDGRGLSVILKPGQTFTATKRAVVLDEQEDVSRERDRVEGRAGEAFWRKVAAASIGVGAVLAVTIVVMGGLAAEHKL